MNDALGSHNEDPCLLGGGEHGLSRPNRPANRDFAFCPRLPSKDPNHLSGKRAALPTDLAASPECRAYGPDHRPGGAACHAHDRDSNAVSLDNPESPHSDRSFRGKIDGAPRALWRGMTKAVCTKRNGQKAQPPLPLLWGEVSNDTGVQRTI